MNLFMILYASTFIGGSWGPLPYGLEECEKRASEMQKDTSAFIETGKTSTGEVIPTETLNKIKTWQFKCEYRRERPQLDEK